MIDGTMNSQTAVRGVSLTVCACSHAHLNHSDCVHVLVYIGVTCGTPIVDKLAKEAT